MNRLQTILSLLLLSTLVACGFGETTLQETSQDISTSSTIGQTCGTIAGLTCSSGEYCKYEACGADMAGVCKKQPTACNKNYKPVCGCDGITYSNSCYAAAAGVTVSKRGECKSSTDKPKKKFCRSNDECGSNEYCKKKSGSCNGRGTCTEKPQACTMIYQPVCGCDGNTYGSDCVAAGSGVSIDYNGTCK